MVDDAIYARLSSYVPLTNLVGSNIWAAAVESGQEPAEQSQWSGLVFMRVDDSPDRSIDGTRTIENARFQFSCMSNVDHRTARQIAEAVEAAMHGYKSSGAILWSSFAGGGMDLYDDETRMHHIPIDFQIFYPAA